MNPVPCCCGRGSTGTIFVFTLNFLSRSRARSLWPEPNDLLALPIENQTLWCERVLRQETSIVHFFGIGAIELRVRYPSSGAQLPLQSCVDSKASHSHRASSLPVWLQQAQRLRSSTRTLGPLVSETAARLKDRRDCGAGVETEFFYSCLNSEELWFKGGRSYRRGRIHSISEEELDEKQLIPEMRRISRVSGWRYC